MVTIKLTEEETKYFREAKKFFEQDPDCDVDLSMSELINKIMKQMRERK